MRYAIVGALLLAACGSGDDVGPAPLFPEIGAHYGVSGTFTGQPLTTYFTGSLIFAHPDSRTGDLQGTADLTLYELGDSIVLGPQPMVQAKMTRDSLISWTTIAGAATWSFEGFFEAGVISGTHRLVGNTGTVSGDFFAQER